MTSDELRALADAATPEPWTIRGLPDEDGRIDGMYLGPNREDFIETDAGHYGPCYENAALIAALGPDAARLLADAMDETKCWWQTKRLAWDKDAGFSCRDDEHYPPQDYCPACALLARFAALGTETT